MDDPAAALRRSLGVVGKEREQSRADRPRDQQPQPAAQAVPAALDLTPGTLELGPSALEKLLARGRVRATLASVTWWLPTRAKPPVAGGSGPPTRASISLTTRSASATRP